MKPKDQNKVEAIYKALLNLVRQKGLAGITMQEIAREAKMATGTLYIYFKNKETLVAALADKCVQHVASCLFKDYSADDSFKNGFAKIWMNIVRHRIEFFNESLFIEQSFHSPFLNEESRLALKKNFDPLLLSLQRGKNEKIIKDIDSFWMLAFIIGGINEIARRVNYFNKKASQQVLETNFQLCWDGIKAA
ncbi:MAG: TetR/AcrR family transcriptional regulator [Flavihumibacter sp.]